MPQTLAVRADAHALLNPAAIARDLKAENDAFPGGKSCQPLPAGHRRRIFFDLIASRSEGKIILAIVVGLVLHALMYAPQAAFFSELFGTSVRYAGASVGYQLASIFAGALAPIIAIELLGDAGAGVTNVPKVAIYMTIASVITIVAVLFAHETKASSLRHDRVLND